MERKQIVRIGVDSSISSELQAVQQRIRERAHQHYLDRGGEIGGDLSDWLKAERELIVTPKIKVAQRDENLIADVDTSAIDTAELTIDVEAQRILVSSLPPNQTIPSSETPALRQVFVLIQLPAAIRPDSVRAENRRGALRLSAQIAGETGVQKMTA